MECIEGQIGQVKYHKTNEYSSSGNRFLISKFTHDNNGKYEDISIKGEMNSPVFGWRYKLYGSFSEDSKYGKTFTFESFEPILTKSHEGMADYLARSVPAIGKIRARLIVDKFGNDTFSILKTDPSRLSEVPGIPRMAREQAEEFFSNDNALEVDPEAYARLYDLLSPIRPPRRIIKSLLQNFGSNAPQFITDHPYRLLDYPGMGWIRVDRFAVEVLKYDPKGLERHKRAILEILSREAEKGHTKSDQATLYCDASNMLGLSLNENTIDSLKKDGSIVLEDDYISSTTLFNAEQSIVRELERIRCCGDSNWSFDISEDEFDEEQKQIPLMVKSNSVCIITGVPGSGKSHSVSIIVKSLHENTGIESSNILVVAPTGKAAKRNDEFLQQSLPGVKIFCSTIHRALGGKLGIESEEGIPQDEARINRGREQFYFEYGKDRKLPFDYFIMDEASMTDVPLFASFLEAIPNGARLLIVGDHHQLPSVGPGSVLRDLIAAEVPTVVLDKPRRNSGHIAQACYLIKEGKCPDPFVLNENWTHVERRDDNRILDTIREIHVRYIAQNSIEKAKEDLQVIAPEKKGILGCHNLNRILGSIMNPDEKPLIESKSRDEDSESIIRLHDKIVRNKNAYVNVLLHNTYESEYDDVKTYLFNGKQYFIGECQVVNGDGGIVEGFKNQDIIVRFSNPDRLCVLSRSESHLSLAYAMTVHKCQGSGFPIVIMPLPVNGYYWNEKTKTGLFSRELLYTAFSRPIDRLITVGNIQAAYAAIGRVTIHQRKTRLKDMICSSSEKEINHVIHS